MQVLVDAGCPLRDCPVSLLGDAKEDLVCELPCAHAAANGFVDTAVLSPSQEADVRALPPRFPGLRRLIFPLGAEVTPPALAALPLRELQLANCTGVGRPACLRAISQLAALQSLDLSASLGYGPEQGQCVPSDAFEATAALLAIAQGCRRLQRLDLSFCEEDLASVAAVACALPDLRKLSLVGCYSGLEVQGSVAERVRALGGAVHKKLHVKLEYDEDE